MKTPSALEQRVISQAFRYCLLDYWVSNDQDNQDFDSLFDSQCQRFYALSVPDACQHVLEELSLSSPEQIKRFFATFSIRINDLIIRADNYGDCNQYLREQGSDLRIFWSLQGEKVEFICGFTQERKIDEFRVYTLTEQCCNTARLAIPMAGLIHQHDIVIRRPCLEALFDIKWRSEWDFKPFPLDPDGPHPLFIGQQLRRRALSYYESLTEFHDQFIPNCEQNVLQHELGHAVIQHDMIASPYAAIAEAFQVISESNIVITFLEILADCAPKRGKKSGILTYLFDSDSDLSKACLALYFSDIWFFDTSESSMFDYSECLSLLLWTYCFDSSRSFGQDVHGTDDALCRQYCQWIEHTVQAFMEQFFTQEQRQFFETNNTYTGYYDKAQAYLSIVMTQKKDAFDAFLSDKREEGFRLLYTSLGHEGLYETRTDMRRQGLFRGLAKSLGVS